MSTDHLVLTCNETSFATTTCEEDNYVHVEKCGIVDDYDTDADAALFNKSPQEFVRKYHNDPKQIASMLYQCHPHINVDLLGTQFGKDPQKYPLWMDILKEYAQCFPFENLPFVQALRQFLYRFRLPGEALQISRIMEAFAHSYFIQNDNKTASTIPTTRTSPTKARGYYIKDIEDEDCCLSCGCLDTTNTPLYQCQGCHSVTFCRKCCMRQSSSLGHAVIGRIGYGPACLAILKRKGHIDIGQSFQYCSDGKGTIRTKLVTSHEIQLADDWLLLEKEDDAPAFGDALEEEEHHHHQRTYCNVFANEDAVFVFAFSVILLTTNLHNPNVKDKMTKQQFIVTNNGINNGNHLPGDYIASVYDDIAVEKINVMTV